MSLSLSLLAFGSAFTDAPSFACGRQINRTERVICEDVELAAYDRAVALLYKRARSASHWPGVASQRVFLRRRDSCGNDRRCVIAAYRGWLDDYGGDILNTSYRGLYRRGLDAATINFIAIGDDWYLFRAGGVVRMSGGTGRAVEGRGNGSCEINFRMLPGDQWQIADNGGCGILPLAGTYQPYN
jgi:hypothetical protein